MRNFGLIALTLCAATAYAQGPFEPDEQTLLLAHFDEDAYQADYANGSEAFAGTGAGLTDGYWGLAVDTRGIQFNEQFMTDSSARLPRNVLWGFLPRGNVDFYQGTLEFWFRVSPLDMPQNHARQNIFFTNWYQAIQGKMTSSLLTTDTLAWQWATLNSEHFSGQITFDPPLSPDDWHHYAMCWSQGEFVIYIDGRALDARDMTGQFGLALVAMTHTPVMMNGSAIDELRISSSVRYAEDFEPAWHGGERPAYAVERPGDIERFDPKIEEPYVPAALPAPEWDEATRVGYDIGDWTLRFDQATGVLAEEPLGRNGLLLWRGVEREALANTTATGWEQAADGTVRFTQEFGDAARAEHALAEVNGALTWEVTLTNTSADDLWLEALLSLPLMGERADDYYDMAHMHDDPSQPMRRDEYIFSLPLAAVSEGGQALGVGIDPHRELSALVSEYVPGGDGGYVLRQGTKLALGPAESFTIPFVIVEMPAKFGALDAIAAYHGVYADLYRQRPEVPIYSYLPVCRYESYQRLPDIWRQTYMGNLWGHGPAFAKGAEWGTEELWEIPYDQTDRADYNYVARLKTVWQSLERMRQLIVERSESVHNEDYTLRRSHYCPNWPNKFLPEMFWPEGMLGGDPLTAGQYYDPTYWHVNEFNTPMGERYKWHTQQIMDAIAGTTPGFINDMCQTSPWRFQDDIARQTPGRAWARDRGEYLVAAFGHADRYRMINDYRDERGFAQSIWSDGGTVSYTLSALSAADALESGVPDVQLLHQELGWRSGRMLLGEKPYTLHYSKEDEWIGRYLDPADLTAQELRDYYRYFFAQMHLMALKHGVQLPFDCAIGQQAAMETQPIVVESIARGRKTVPGVRVGGRTDIFDHVFARRAGTRLDSFVVIGNELPQAVTEDVTCYPAYFGGTPLFGAYYGGEIRHSCGEQTVLREVTVEPRSMTALRCIGLLTGGGEITTQMEGDGIAMSATITGGDAGALLQVAPMGPLYEIASVTRDGQPVELADGQVALGGTVRVTWRNRALDFSAQDWTQMELLRDGATNFCVVADCSTPYRAGTAGMLNQFLEQYDEEDGVLGNLAPAAIGEAAPQGFAGWQIVIDDSAAVDPARARIDVAGRRVVVEGSSPGEARRALVVLLRMVDRKYPHVGRFYPLKYYGGDEPWTNLGDEQTQSFFAAFEDPKFLVKPILAREYEELYADGNVDFAGAYSLREPVCIYEPTYPDDYVYGREE